MSVMPFGKHKGLPISALPTPYIEWALEQTFIQEPLRSQLQHALDGPRPQLVTRSNLTETTYPPALQGYIRSIVLEGFKVGLTKLADQPEKLKSLKSAREFLEQHLGL